MATDRLVWRTRRSPQILEPSGNSSGLSTFPSINYSFRMATEDIYLKLRKTDGATILMGRPDRLFIRAAALIPHQRGRLSCCSFVDTSPR